MNEFHFCSLVLYNTRMKKQQLRTRAKVIAKLIGLVIIFAGVLMLGLGFGINSNSLLGYCGLALSILGLIITASPQAWGDFIVALLMS